MSFFSLHFNPIEQKAKNNIFAQMKGIAQTTQRLSTGLRVNTPKDDPAAFIGGELLKSENVEIKANQDCPWFCTGDLRHRLGEKKF